MGIFAGKPNHDMDAKKDLKKRVYADISGLTDREIVDALLRRDPEVTESFLFGKCYPLFVSVFVHYDTGCENVMELINMIYALLLIPVEDHDDPCAEPRCRLERFEFGCTLTRWLKIVLVNFSRGAFRKKSMENSAFSADDDRREDIAVSLEESFRNLTASDADRILRAMPSRRFARLLRLRYLEGYDNKETAAKLETDMSNYYNMHRRAKLQLKETLRKEGLR